MDRALQTQGANADSASSFILTWIQAKHDFGMKAFDDLPARIHELASAAKSMYQEYKSGKRIKAAGADSSTMVALADLASVENVIFILGTALLVRLRKTNDIHNILKIWRAKSSDLPIKENAFSAIDRIESILLTDTKEALTLMGKQELIDQKWFITALNVIHNVKASPEDLFHAHALIAAALIVSEWEDFVALDLAELLVTQWLEKIKLPAMLKLPRITVHQIDRACKSSETGKKKIGQILLAVQQAVSVRVAPEMLQQFRSWTENPCQRKNRSRKQDRIR